MSDIQFNWSGRNLSGKSAGIGATISDPSSVTVASAIGSASEAKWSVAEMNKALGHDTKKISAIS